MAALRPYLGGMSQKEDEVIEGIGRSQPPRAVSTGTEATRTSGADAAPRMATVGNDRVGRDSVGRDRAAPASGLSGIAADLAAKPPVDAAKIERLRAAIVGGDYRPDPHAIAAAMIALESPSPGK